MNEVWSVIQGIGALAGIVALSVQAVGAWRRRHAPRDIDGLRDRLDAAYRHVLGIESRVGYGTPSLEMVGDVEAADVCIDFVRYAGRLADPVLSETVREAGMQYHLAFAIGTNLNGPMETRDRGMIDSQLKAARRSLDAIKRAHDRLDEIERRIRP